MRFHLGSSGPCVEGELSYIPEDHSFRFEAESLPLSVASLQINMLQINLDDKGKLLYPWGYCPLLRFDVTDLSPPQSTQGQLLVDLEEELIPGVSKKVNSQVVWPVSINPADMWVCLGDPHPLTRVVAVEFAQSCVAVIDDNALLALWLHPQKLPSAST